MKNTLKVSKAIETLIQAGYSVSANKEQIKMPKDVAKFLAPYAHAQVEYFLVVTLDTKNKVIGCHEVYKGTLDQVNVHCREVFKLAIQDSAASIILGHNHPSGDLEPSDNDLELTRKFIEAGKLLGINVHDHVIVGLNGFLSMREETYLW